MIPKVELLWLCGMPAAEAVRAADGLVRDRSVPDLSRLLVIDDTAALAAHSSAFDHLLTSGRVPHLVCVAVGPPAQPGLLQVPGNLRAGQESAVLWVADRFGVDWPVGSAGVPLMRADGGPDGVQRLIEVLSSSKVYDRLRELAGQVPNGIACPGLRLAESDADAADFPAALAAAITRLLERPPGEVPGGDDPFTVLVEARPAGEPFREDGELARGRERCRAAAEEAQAFLTDLASVAGLLAPGRPAADVRVRALALGQALASLRELSCRLLEELPAFDRLTDRQRERLRRAGLNLTSRPAGQDGSVEAQPAGAVPEAITASLRAGDSLPRAADRLAATEPLLRSPGTTTHRAQVDECCPPSLVDRLLGPPEFPPVQSWLPLAGLAAAAMAGLAGPIAGLAAALAWTGLVGLTIMRGGPARRRLAPLAVSLAAALAGAAIGWAAGRALHPPPPATATGAALALLLAVAAIARSWRQRARRWRQLLAPEQAPGAAWALTALVSSAAAGLWSADAGRLAEVARARIAVSAITGVLEGYHGEHQAAGRESARRSAPLAGFLLPTVIDLVLAVLTAQLGQGHRAGVDVQEGAQTVTAGLIAVWAGHVRDHGLLAPPVEAWARYLRHQELPVPASFTVSDDDRGPGYSMAGWHDAIREAAGADPQRAMWQLCLPDALGMLDAGSPYLALPFAPDLTRRALGGAMPAGTQWTVGGHRAGLLRLVPIRLAAVVTSWPVSQGQEQPA